VGRKERKFFEEEEDQREIFISAWKKNGIPDVKPYSSPAFNKKLWDWDNRFFSF